MFKDIFLFEIRYRLKRPATYIYLGIMILTGLLYGAIMGGAMGPEPAGMITGGGKNLANSAFNLHQLLFSLTQVPGIFIVAAIMAVPVYRDFQNDSHSLFFTKPISKASYLLGRYMGSLVVTLGVMLGLAFGLMITEMMPYVLPEKYGPFNLAYYLNPFLINVIPFVLFTGTIFFATVSLTRNQLFIYLNAIIVLVLFTLASYAATQIENKMLASLLDPSGGAAFLNETEFWTTAERNTKLVPFSMNITLNMLIWLGVAAGIMAFTLRKFSFSYVREAVSFSRPKANNLMRSIGDTVTIKKIVLPSVNQEFSLGKYLSQFWLLTKREIAGILKSPIFIAIMLVGSLMTLMIMAFFNSTLFGTPTLPVTYKMIGTITGGLALFVFALIIFYSGELVWKERSVKVNQIYDTLPIPGWVTYASKFVALVSIPFVVFSFGILMGIFVQLGSGYTRIELGQYIGNLLGYRIIDFILFALLAMFVQVTASNKFVGFFITVLIFFFNNSMLGTLGVEHNLFQYMSNTRLTYSDMNGYGHFPWPFMAFKLYWTGMGMLLGLFANLLWQRGTENTLRSRINNLKQSFSGTSWVALLAGLVLFIGMGAYIFYNTNILNEYKTSKEGQAETAEFEKIYKKYDGIPQPKVTAVNLHINIYPETRSFDAKGKFMLKNKTNVPIDSVHLLLNSDVEFQNIEFGQKFEPVSLDDKHRYYIYQFDQPLQPGDSVSLDFEAAYAPVGFTNTGSPTGIVENGTFFNHFYFPLVGYTDMFEIRDTDIREKYGLGERERFPSIDDTAAVYNTLIAHDADWIDFEATVSTSPDQIAVVPGYLQKEWEENGRRYFHYKMDSKMLKFYSIVSARYEVEKDVWKAPDGRDINLEIYYHGPHTHNINRMMEAMKKSLAYYTENFSPYQHQQVRILEFPRYASFAQSFANTIPYSEAVGFIADVDEDDVDYPFYITAHELGHQWWAHQVIGGNVQGFQFLSETMSQYSALMVMEKEFGEENIQKYLKYEMNQYLKNRSAERVKELPALLSENQLYIHYNKGSVIMYALKDYIGEDSLNAALSRYIDAVAFQEPPYTTTREWLSYVREVTPDSLQYILTDMFETITLFDNRVTEATYEEVDDTYKVTFKVEAKKLRDDGTGEETEIGISDYIDIGIFGREKVDGKWKDIPLYFQKHKITDQETEFTFTVDSQPRKVGIDPYNKLIDRKPDDNTKRVTKKNN
jgi:ABC-2 type transport system permease protein